METTPGTLASASNFDAFKLVEVPGRYVALTVFADLYGLVFFMLMASISR